MTSRLNFNIVPHETLAAVAELADARDLKSLGGKLPCRFDPGQRHQKKQPKTHDSKLTI